MCHLWVTATVTTDLVLHPTSTTATMARSMVTITTTAALPSHIVASQASPTATTTSSPMASQAVTPEEHLQVAQAEHPVVVQEVITMVPPVADSN